MQYNSTMLIIGVMVKKNILLPLSWNNSISSLGCSKQGGEKTLIEKKTVFMSDYMYMVGNEY